MTKKTVGLALIIIGIVVMGISLAADPLGIGAAVGVIGWKQMTGTVVGVIVLLVGIWLSRNVKP